MFKRAILFLEVLRRVNICDYVTYDKKKCVVSNLVAYPRVDLYEIEWLSDGTRNSFSANITSVRKYPTIHNVMNALRIMEYYKQKDYFLKLKQKI